MISEIIFRAGVTVCPGCHSHFVARRTERRTVRSSEMVEFTAVHKVIDAEDMEQYSGPKG